MFGQTFDEARRGESASFAHDHPHVTMTQCALQVLLMCGDDLSRVDRHAVCAHLAELQQEDGSFSAVAAESAAECGERDIRFAFSAAVVSFILDDWSGFDRDRAYQHILESQSYEGGFGQVEFLFLIIVIIVLCDCCYVN